MTVSSGQKYPGGGRRPGAKPQIAILILAAGASSRMRGADKLLEDVNGQPCLQVMAERACATGLPVVVTLPRLDHPRSNCLDHLDLTRIPVPDAEFGLSRSLQRGASALPANAQAMMILPADMPEITTYDMTAMIGSFTAEPCDALQASTQDGEPGHPTIIGKSLLGQFHTLTGDRGAARLIKETCNKRLFPLKDKRARLDLDTPEDWASWRAK